MEFFYQNFDFICLFTSITLVPIAFAIDDLLKFDKIKLLYLRYISLFLLVQSVLGVMDLFLIYAKSSLHFEYVSIPLIIISFSILLESFLYIIQKRGNRNVIRFSFYGFVLAAMIVSGIYQDIAYLVKFITFYCLAVTVLAFYPVFLMFREKFNWMGAIGFALVFIYAITFSLFPITPLRQFLLETVETSVIIQMTIKLVVCFIGCYAIWLYLNIEISKDDNLDSINKFPKHIFAFLFIFIILASWICVDFVGKLAEKKQEDNLKNQSNLIISTLSSSHLKKMIIDGGLSGERSQSLVQLRLTEIVSSQQDFQYAYIISLDKSDKIKFEMEMESTAYKLFSTRKKSDIKPQGNLLNKVKFAYETKKAKIYSPFFMGNDIWTTIITPILNPDTGEVIAVFGIDVNYLAWKIPLFNFRLFPILFTLFLSLLISLIFREITNRRRMEQRIFSRNQDLLKLNLAIKKTKDELEAANKTKSEFLSNMSHELRTPLNAILGFSEILTNEMFGPLDGKYKEYSALIHKSGTHLLSLINDVLDISKIEAGKMTVSKSEASLFQLLEDCLNITLAYPGAKERKFTTNMPTDDILIQTDERMFKQILLNLLSNAIKFTPRNGEIRIDIVPKEETIKYIIADSGIGISDSNLKKVLEPFSQVEKAQTREYQGTGLGLSIVLKLVELLGGEFNISSIVGEGTTIEIELPIN